MNKPIKKFAVAINEHDDECCGIDAYFVCDGRWSINKCVVKATEHFNMINRNLGKGYRGFHICIGKFPNGNQYSRNYYL